MKLVKYENNDSGGMQNLPYEKFISYGAETLTDSELLAIIIRTGTQEMSARKFPNFLLFCSNSAAGQDGVSFL